jgi:NADPH-dependent ferric siderophore reductase
VSAPLVRRSPVHSAHVVALADLTARMRRITVRAETMAGIATRPAQDVEVFLQTAEGRRVKRRYTIRHARTDSGQLDLDVLVHGHGPGSTWAETVRVGDALEFQGPRGKLELTAAAWHLLIGDESALPAISAVCEALPADEPAIAVIEVGGKPDELPFPDAVDVHWVHRGSVPAGTADLLSTAVDGLLLPDGDGHGYLMGETRAMVTLRGVLEARGLEHDAIFVKGYWNQGRPDRIAGRSPGAS